MTDITAHVAKVRQFPLENTIIKTDYDKTAADKLDPTNPDHTPFLLPHYKNWQRMAHEGARIVVVTARGEQSAKNYLTEHAKTEGPIPGLILASNSGFVINRDIFGSNSRETLLPPNYDKPKLDKVVSNIHGLINGMKDAFQTITADKRELCGAVIYKLDGTEQDKQFVAFQALWRELVKRMPKNIGENIEAAPKSWAFTGPEGKPETHGYIDFIPKGLEKSGPTFKLLQEAADALSGKPRVITAGDSMSDGPMIEAVAKTVGLNDRVMVSVGDGLREWGIKKGFQDLLVLEANGHSAVNRYHMLLAEVGQAHISPSRATRPLTGPNANASRLRHLDN